MPLNQESTQNYNVKLVHSTKPSSPEEPVQLAFSVTDNGMEQIITAEVDSQRLFEIAQENRWLQGGTGFKSGTKRMRIAS